ncbi:MAG: hypothetical protein CVV47_09460 [Spirochaetae bacterium HGW-Spirochaetae-3]|nr:MAG: hypothetical protein CVV47_09460 [Spirochaetae bacterium HGW-Spirochaetae-3]
MRKTILLAVLSLSLSGANAQDWLVNWNLGTFDIAGDCLPVARGESYDFDASNQFSLSFIDVAFRDVERGYGLSVSLIKVRDNYDDDITSLLPLEAYVRLAGRDPLSLALYGKAELGYTDADFAPYFEGGLQFSFMPEAKMEDFYYSSRNSIFLGLNNELQLVAGVRIDLGLFLLLSLYSESDRDE